MPDQTKNSSAETVLHHAILCLEKWEKKRTSLDDILDSPKLAELKIRNTVSDLLFNYFRHKGLIDAIIDNFTKDMKPGLRYLLVLCLTQTLYQSGINKFSAINIAVDYGKAKFGKKAGGFINAVLRNTQRLDLPKFINSSPEWIRLNLPEFVYCRWQNYFKPVQIEGMCQQFQEKPPLTFRLLQTVLEDELDELDCELMQLPEWAEDYPFYSCRNPHLLLNSSLLEEGKVYIQDPSTLLAPSMAAGNAKTILDTCAAPGGKSLALAQRFPDSLLVAGDRSFKRQQRTIVNLAKLDQPTFACVADGCRLPFAPNAFDLILLDVPCSNTGVIRHRPDAIWRFSQDQLKELISLQKKLLETAIECLKPEGYLIYSTCSIETEENSLQISNFLKQYPNFTLVKEHQLLPSGTHDGAYAALLKRFS